VHLVLEGEPADFQNFRASLVSPLYYGAVLHLENGMTLFSRLGLSVAFSLVMGIFCTSQAEADLQSAYARIKPSVVYIVCAVPDGAASGSGFIIESDRTKSVIVTANHVVEGASSIDVIVNSDVSKRYHATVVEHDHMADVAILEIPIGNLHAVHLASTKSISEGMAIAVVGYPRAAQQFEKLDGDQLRPSIHAGILSAIRLDGEIYQFDAAVDHGDSGGPVIDASSGYVLGIVRGSLLDPAYVARGLEQPLPGSAIAISGRTIEHIARGDSSDSSVSAAGSGSLTAGRSSSSDQTGQDAMQTQKQSSNSFRLAFFHQSDAGTDQQTVIDGLDQRALADLTKDNEFYAVPFRKETSDNLYDTCQDLRVSGYIIFTFYWKSSVGSSWLPYVGTTYHRNMSSAVGLTAADCSGRYIFSSVKTKSESGNTKAWQTEVGDIDNDLIDKLESEFNDFKSLHAAAWTNFVKTGLFLDPNDDHTYALWGLLKKQGEYRVNGIYPNGPASIAGIHAGDIVESIAGSSIADMTSDEIDALTNHGTFVVVVKRPEGNISLTVIPRKYAELMSMTGH
jgi:S1-C subfamily serine protease